MNLHEYQGKELQNSFGVRIQRGIVAKTAEEAVVAAKKLNVDTGTSWWVIKAQIHAGGRGKGGGVKLAKSLDEVKSISDSIEIILVPCDLDIILADPILCHGDDDARIKINVIGSGTGSIAYSVRYLYSLYTANPTQLQGFIASNLDSVFKNDHLGHSSDDSIDALFVRNDNVFEQNILTSSLTIA